MSRPKRRGPGWLLPVACLIGLGLVLGWLRSHAVPSTEAVRLRNALLFAGSAPEAAFDWVPASVPDTFPRDDPRATGAFGEELAAQGIAQLASDEQRMVAIASMLTRHAGAARPAMSDLRGTYRSIVAGRGYCSDFTSVFLAMAAEAGLFAREWAFSFDGFGGWGHAVVEVFDRERGKWVFLDVFNNFRVRDAATGELLGVREFRARLLDGGTGIRREPIGPGRPGFATDEAALRYYRAGATQWYLWLGNAVLRYDRDPWVALAGRGSRALEQLTAIALGIHPKILAVDLPQNRTFVQSMQRLRVKLLLAAAVGTLSAAILLGWLVRIVAVRRKGRAKPPAGPDGSPVAVAGNGPRN